MSKSTSVSDPMPFELLELWQWQVGASGGNISGTQSAVAEPYLAKSSTCKNPIYYQSLFGAARDCSIQVSPRARKDVIKIALLRRLYYASVLRLSAPRR